MPEKQQIPTSVIAVVIVVVVMIVGYMGWRYVNPPDLQPVGAQGAQVTPSVVPGEQGTSGPGKGPGKPGPAAPIQPQ